jgi:hypothetical protein
VLDGARTQKAWLTARSELSKAQANRALKLDRDLARYPRLLDAWRRGVLGTDKVRLLLDAAPHVEAMLERDQSMLIERLRTKTVDGARASIRLWREGALAELSESPDDPPPDDPVVNSVKIRAGVGTERCLSGIFDAVTGGEVAGLLEGEVDRCFRTGEFTSEDDLTQDERMARALLGLLRRGSQVETDGGEPKRAVSMLVDLRWLFGFGDRAATASGEVLDWPCELADGTPVPLAQVLDSLDDSTINLILGTLGLKAKGFKPVGEVTTQRLANASQRRMLRARDRGCIWPGCDAPATWCQAHHEPPFEDTHRTTTSELLLFCRFHHTLRHRGGHDVQVDRDGTVTIHRPDRTPIPAAARGDKLPWPDPDPPPDPPVRSTSTAIVRVVTDVVPWGSRHDAGPPARTRRARRCAPSDDEPVYIELTGTPVVTHRNPRRC